MSAAIEQGAVIPPRTFGPFGSPEVVAYAEASGDDNPLHVDPAVAALAGLPRPPIHGMLMMGCFQPYVQAWRPEARVVKLSAKFIRPVLVGQAIEVSGKVVQVRADAKAALRLTIKRDGELVCLAEALVRP